MTTSTLTPLHTALAGMITDYETYRDRAGALAVFQEQNNFDEPFDPGAEERSIAYGAVLRILEPLTASTLPAGELRLLMLATARELDDRGIIDHLQAGPTDTVHLTAAAELRRVAFTPAPSR